MSRSASRSEAVYSGPIHTLNARDNVLLDVVRDYFELDAASLHSEIRAGVTQVRDVLATDGVEYRQLRSALVPQTVRREVAYLFDSLQIESNWYGREVHTIVLQNLALVGSRHSILSGDLLGRIDQSRLRRILESELHPQQQLDYQASNQYYLIYINNLTSHAAAALHAEFQNARGYVGYLDMTYSSYLKFYLSVVIGATYMIHDGVAIMSHEDDIPNTVNQNTPGYPFEAHGYRCVSLQATLFGLFLSYKIEAPVLPGFESDIEFSLNAVTTDVASLNDFTVDLPQEKFQYLRTQKTASLDGLGITVGDRDLLSRLIQDRLDQGYLYNLEYMPEHDVVKFNVMLEAKPHPDRPFKALASLRYLAAERLLRVITVY